MSSKANDAEAKEDENKAVLGPKPLPYAFEKELIQNQNKRFDIVEDFIPTHNVLPIERKFWSKYEQKLPHYEDFLECTERTQLKRTTNGYPRLESQVYGWRPDSFNRKDLTELNFIRGPKQRCDMTIYGEKLCSERVTERPDFNGLRFLR